MKKYIVRANEKHIFESFERPLVSALLGPRRVGKTTLLNFYKALHPERKWVSLNMDVLSQRKRIANEELELLIEQEALQKIGREQKIWVFIDEAQKCPELFDQVKLIYDTHKDQDHIKFILTGSAHLNLHQLTAESLAGRVELLQLREFNLRELTHLLHPHMHNSLDSSSFLELLCTAKDCSAHTYAQLQDQWQAARPWQQLLEQSLDTHLVWGGLPETFDEKTEKYHLKYLGDYLQTYLEKDIRAIDTIGDLPLFEKLLKVCAETTGSLRDDKKLIDALRCSRITLGKYRDYLLATLQYAEVYPHIGASIRRLVKSPKGYVVNNGLVSYLTGIHSLPILKTTGYIGHRLENWFLNEMQTWLDTAAERHEISFWRTSSGGEVDFIVTLGPRVIPFEITYAQKPDIKKIHNIKNFMKNEPKSTFGVICYLGPLQYDEGERILYLPAWLI